VALLWLVRGLCWCCVVLLDGGSFVGLVLRQCFLWFVLLFGVGVVCCG